MISETKMKMLEDNVARTHKLFKKEERDAGAAWDRAIIVRQYAKQRDGIAKIAKESWERALTAFYEGKND